MKRLLRGPAASRLLAKAGIDARRFWLLSDLFGELAERREILSHLGRDGLTLKIASWLYVLLGGVLSLAILAGTPSAARMIGMSCGFTALMLFCVLTSEAGNSLVNPVEALVLAHQPIDGATYTAAKLTHLLRVVGYLAPALNAVPAIAGAFFVKRPFWYYPLVHLAATYLTGLAVALIACAIFGWLLRFVPPARLKSIGQIVESLPFLGMMFSGQLLKAVTPVVRRLMPESAGWRSAIVIGGPVLLVIGVVMGLRSLRVDYLLRVATIVHGGGGRRVKVRKSWMGDVVARWLGGPAARAGFAYTARLMRRDYAFRRQILPMLPISIMPLFGLIESARTDPFSGTFTTLHVMPHAFGIILFTIASVLVYGSDYKGTWVFLVAPSGAFDGFARGVHGLIWFAVIGVPHAVLAAILFWFWNAVHAAAFLAYSMVFASLYLGLVLRLVDGVPFSKQPVTSRNVYLMGIMLLGGMCMALAVGFQHFLLFRSVAAVVGASVVIGGAAVVATRSSLNAFAITMRYNLGLESADVGPMFREIE
jgi:hypothetical protein